MAKRQDRKFLGVVYPDSESYSCDEVLAKICNVFPEYAYILHDKDVGENGDLKKPHIHWVGRFKSARALQPVCEDIGMATNMVEYCGDFTKAIQYLAHYNDPDKFQYPVEDIVTNVKLERIFRPDLDEIEQAKILKTRIVDGRCISIRQAISDSLEDGTYSTLRRGGSLWCGAIAENRMLNLVEHDQAKLISSDMKKCIKLDEERMQADFVPFEVVQEPVIGWNG